MLMKADTRDKIQTHTLRTDFWILDFIDCGKIPFIFTLFSFCAMIISIVAQDTTTDEFSFTADIRTEMKSRLESGHRFQRIIKNIFHTHPQPMVTPGPM